MTNFINYPQEISLLDIDQFIQSVGGPNFNGSAISLSGSEINYMGSETSVGDILVSKLCMPGQQEVRFKDPDWSVFSSSPGTPNNYYNGADIPWRPTRFSEFYNAYTPITFNVTIQGTGSVYGGNLVLDMVGGTAPYFVYSSTDSSWGFTSTSQYVKYAYNGFTTNFYVVDATGCGGNFEISSSGHYPGPYG
jgi:hypothetical protein